MAAARMTLAALGPANARSPEGVVLTHKHRLVGALFGVAALWLGLTSSATKAENFDPEERFTNGMYRQYYTPGISPIARSTSAAPSGYGPNTIVISTSQRRLYYITGSGQAIGYGIGVGRAGFAWSGVTRVSAKKAWPSWTPPAQMRRRQPGLPGHMTGGINNPLGARALYLGSSLYRIHGSNEPQTIGQAVSSGCFRMTNEDVIDLYNRVSVGTKVVVLR
jgi:lipoprotein-anchoring transpeptidase ErfK/SrfK